MAMLSAIETIVIRMNGFDRLTPSEPLKNLFARKFSKFTINQFFTVKIGKVSRELTIYNVNYS
ncbi:hypothetical protein CYCD_05270 [Tenuifilaceae bacterium CYCD]|nr:hypothetical protein CYCD_05270 [Tenuifilaceae bacterium CYCD]